MKDVLHPLIRDALRRMGKMNGLDAKIEVGNRIAGFITQGLGWVVEHVERDMERRSKRKRSGRTKPGMEDDSEGMMSECKRSRETKPGMEDDSEGMMSECKQSRETKPGMEDDSEGIMSKHPYGGPQLFCLTGWDGMCKPIPYAFICSHKSDRSSRDSFPAEVCGSEDSGVTIVPWQVCSWSWIKEAKMIMIMLMLFVMTSWFLPLNIIRRKLRTRRNDRRLANTLLESKMYLRDREISKFENRESVFPKRELFKAQCHCGKLSCSVKLPR